jgi:hypothetical protein
MQSPKLLLCYGKSMTAEDVKIDFYHQDEKLGIKKHVSPLVTQVMFVGPLVAIFRAALHLFARL